MAFWLTGWDKPSPLSRPRLILAGQLGRDKPFAFPWIASPLAEATLYRAAETFHEIFERRFVRE
jgi:hypothetical protein